VKSSARIEKAPTFGNVLTRTTPRAELPAIARPARLRKTRRDGSPGTDLQYAMLVQQRKRLFHNIGNLQSLKALRTPPPKDQNTLGKEGAANKVSKLVNAVLQ